MRYYTSNKGYYKFDTLRGGRGISGIRAGEGNTDIRAVRGINISMRVTGGCCRHTQVIGNNTGIMATLKR